MACSEESPLIHQERFQGAYEFRRGDVEGAFSASDIVMEDAFYSPRQEHAFLEPEGGIAYIDIDGTIVVCAGMQDPYRIRAYVARTLGIKEHQVRGVIPPLGGAFGGKQSVSVHIHLALLTLMTKRPVKMLWTREESMLVHPKRHPARMKCKLGLNRDGKIMAYAVDVLFDGGAYAHQSQYYLLVDSMVRANYILTFRWWESCLYEQSQVRFGFGGQICGGFRTYD
jgi:CO/xanthine dehydrogenase Mo-binding subunit